MIFDSSLSRLSHAAKVRKQVCSMLRSIIRRAGLPLERGWTRMLRLTWRSRPTFDGESAFAYLVRQCEFGPRTPGSAGHARCLAYLTDTLVQYCDHVAQKPFTYPDRERPGVVHEGTNLVGSFHPRLRHDRILLCAHWDTRPWADEDPDPAQRMRPVPGANDGASGVAVLLEMARIMSAHAPPCGVDLVLFDLEDMGHRDYAEHPEMRNSYGIGAAYFVAHHPTYRPRFGILLDMVGGRGLQVRPEAYSQHYARAVVERVWRAAEKVNAPAFRPEPTEEGVVDDHLPFLRNGVEVVDLIDLNYPYWHTRADTPDKCCPESLQQVGDVLVEVLYGSS